MGIDEAYVDMDIMHFKLAKVTWVLPLEIIGDIGVWYVRSVHFAFGHCFKNGTRRYHTYFI
jgi:hypothetical protein